MSRDPILADVVRAWVCEEVPAAADASGGAAMAAVEAHAEGAAIDEAFGVARAYARSWSWHPSQLSPPLRLVS